MVKSKAWAINNRRKTTSNNSGRKRDHPFDSLVSWGKISKDMINSLYKPVDAVNRFLNLTLQHVGEDSTGRQFLLESKSGLRKMSLLLNRLSDHTKKLEREIEEISKHTGE